MTYYELDCYKRCQMAAVWLGLGTENAWLCLRKDHT